MPLVVPLYSNAAGVIPIVQALTAKGMAMETVLAFMMAVIDLGARYCIPCKKMAPILESLAGEYRGKASVLFVDVNANQAAPGRFRMQMIPTQIFFDARGKEVKRHIGFMEKGDIARELKALGIQ